MATIKITEKAKEARRAYQKAWRAKNKDKVIEYSTRYWLRKAKEAEQAKEGSKSK